MDDLTQRMDQMLEEARADGERPMEWAISYRAASILLATPEWATDADPRVHSYRGLPVVIDPGVIGVSLRSAPTRDGQIERERGATTISADDVATTLG